MVNYEFIWARIFVVCVLRSCSALSRVPLSTGDYFCLYLRVHYARMHGHSTSPKSGFKSKVDFTSFTLPMVDKHSHFVVHYGYSSQIIEFYLEIFKFNFHFDQDIRHAREHYYLLRMARIVCPISISHWHCLVDVLLLFMMTTIIPNFLSLTNTRCIPLG